MIEPSIDSLQERIRSKYTLATLSAKRARQIRESDHSLLENPKAKTYVGIALEEIQHGKLTLDEED